MIKSKPTLLQKYGHGVKYFYMEDVAIIKLREPYWLDHKINSICLPKKPLDESWYGTRVQFAGWGFFDETKNRSSILQHVSMGIMNSEGCFRNYVNESVTLPPKLWTEVKKKGFRVDTSPNAGTCTGDSGGAAVWKDKKDNNRAFAIGIATATDLICGPGMKPSVFSTIPGKVGEWIKKVAKDDICVV